MRLKWVVMVAVALGAFFTGGWLLRRGMTTMAGAAGPAGTPVPAMAPTRLFSAVVATVRGSAVDSMDESTIYRLATAGVLGELQDPYATLVSAADTTTADRIGAVPVQGVYLDRVEDFVEVVAIVPGSPGASAGIRPGDAVLRVGRLGIGDRGARKVGDHRDARRTPADRPKEAAPFLQNGIEHRRMRRDPDPNPAAVDVAPLQLKLELLERFIWARHDAKLRCVLGGDREPWV